MEQLESARKKVIELLGTVDDVDDAVVRAKRLYQGKCYAIAYFDLADDIVKRADNIHEFQERILGDDFFGTPGDLRWNNYLYFVAGPKSLSDSGFDLAKAVIEADKEYARKRVVSEDELEVLLGNVTHFTPKTTGQNYNVVAEWEKRLGAAGLDELLDKPTRREIVERIGKGAVARVPVTDKSLTLVEADKPLTQTWLASIAIDKFRPVHDGKSYSFGQVTLIVGPNGTGKTSLLESIEHFYCGANRRPGIASKPIILGTLVGHETPLSAPSDAARIRARCVSWYKRNEQRSNRILDAFTRFNFLDTDAAFRLATDSDEEAAGIPADLGRLLVGSDASGIWEYLSKLGPEVDTALERTIFHADDLTRQLDDARRKLSEVESRPSNSKTLADAFRLALAGLGWKAPFQSSALLSPSIGLGLHEGMGHLQGVLSAGAGATTMNAVAARQAELAATLNRARPFEKTRAESDQAAKQYGVATRRHEQMVQSLERWLTYLYAGYPTARTRRSQAKAAADSVLGKLGPYASADTPEVPDLYAAEALDESRHKAYLNVQNTSTLVASLERHAATYGKMAASRAEITRQLQQAAQAALKAGHPADDCPVCRAKYQPNELAMLIGNITAALEQPSELAEVSKMLVSARKDLEHFKEWLNFFNYLSDAAKFVSLPANAPCGVIAKKIIELKAQLAQANQELQAANREWEQFSRAGLTSTEHDLLLASIASRLGSEEKPYDLAIIDENKQSLLATAIQSRRMEAECIERRDKAVEQIRTLVAGTFREEWSTRAQGGGLQTLEVMLNECSAINSRVTALGALMDVRGDQPLAEIINNLMSAAKLYAEASEAAKEEGTASKTVRALKEQVEALTTRSDLAKAKVNNYRVATETLASILRDCSVERATEATLRQIGAQINEIFSRIHTPNEYEYVGNDGLLLRTTATNQTRSLHQVSTGQRAAFALSVFLAMNRNATTAPPVILIDDPIAHIDDLNALSFLDYLRDLAVNSNRQIFFATADTKIAALFARKFGFLGESFRQILLS